MRILITGGAGYIGSHTVHTFLDAGYQVVVVDNLSTGLHRLLPDKISFHEGNVGDKKFMEEVFSRYKIDTVLHFAGSIIVSESVENPLKYYENNTAVSLSLLQLCVQKKVRNFIFSSTAAVYGNNPQHVMREDSALYPASPYASSKLMTETMIRDVAAVTDLNFIILRYFNVAGADPEGRTGQVKRNATHLIKVACEAALGMRDHIDIYGTDYNTPDGTCIRDYIHVSDLAQAHLKAYEYMKNGAVKKIFNCGYGVGFSVKEVIEAVEKVVGGQIKKNSVERRAGDPVSLIADPTALKNETGWSPKHNDLHAIISSAMQWEKSALESIWRN